LINALLREAGLLPSAAGECTLSITNLAKPAAGKGEHVEVHYFTKEEALKNVFTNIRYKPLFGAEGEALIAEFSNKRALTLLNDEIAATGQGRCEVDISTNELAKRRLELREFCEQLSDKESQDKLGSVVYDSIKASSQYLTTDHDGTGMGHLLLIQMVNIYKDNEMFARDGIEIIDLPGTDSINERQRELTHAYLNGTGMGHLLLIQMVNIYKDNEMFARDGIEHQEQDVLRGQPLRHPARKRHGRARQAEAPHRRPDP
jgi:hypothetical protein